MKNGAPRQPGPAFCGSDQLFGLVLPSVAQPPLPLQEFFPLQPLSPLEQPPLPLQEFLPLHACFSIFLSSNWLATNWPAFALPALPEGAAAVKRAIGPPSSPVKRDGN